MCNFTCGTMSCVTLSLHWSDIDYIYQVTFKIRGVFEDNSKIFFLFLNENICCDLSLV